ncbi:MAG: type II toxin-antitoxin system HipA family toxin [Candidatus Cybelea sp.]|jgi:serine/threonine-protein kinase HipA
MRTKPGTPLRIFLNFGAQRRVSVGRIALDRGIALLEYDSDFIASGLTLNPYLPPPAKGLVEPKSPRDFDGLPGFIADSLPDAWGRLLMHRRAEAAGISYSSLTPLDKLAVIGSRAMGALTYEPEIASDHPEAVDLERLAAQSLELLEGRDIAMLPVLERLGGSSGGARPKALIAFNQSTNAIADGTGRMPNGFEAWLVKFRSSRNDLEDFGPQEAAYADMARDAGLSVAPTRLFPGTAYGYFGTQRFDRLAGDGRLHMLSAAAMLDMDWESGGLDYDHLLRLGRYVVQRHDAAERLFARMVFNVVASNRDDHAKQHAFLMNERGAWDLAPSFDLTFARGRGGEHYLAVKGREGDDITTGLMVELGREHGIDAAESRSTIERTTDAVNRFEEFTRLYPMSTSTRHDINRALQSNLVRLAGRSTPVRSLEA